MREWKQNATRHPEQSTVERRSLVASNLGRWMDRRTDGRTEGWMYGRDTHPSCVQKRLFAVTTCHRNITHRSLRLSACLPSRLCAALQGRRMRQSASQAAAAAGAYLITAPAAAATLTSAQGWGRGAARGMVERGLAAATTRLARQPPPTRCSPAWPCMPSTLGRATSDVSGGVRQGGMVALFRVAPLSSYLHFLSLTLAPYVLHSISLSIPPRPSLPPFPSPSVPTPSLPPTPQPSLLCGSSSLASCGTAGRTRCCCRTRSAADRRTSPAASSTRR